MSNCDASSLEDEDKIFNPQLRGKRTVGKFKCRVPGCSQRFKREVQLDRHEYKHTGLRKFPCNFDGCDKSYITSTNFKRHVKITHENCRPKKDIICTIVGCNRTFCSTYSLQRHIREVHENPRVFPCPDCSVKFQKKAQLRRHIVTHTGQYPYKCDYCEKGFVVQRDCLQHKCPTKSYKCASCEKEFQHWSSLVIHRRTNHRTLFKCDQCGKELARKSYLKQHMQKHMDPGEREVLKCPWQDCERTYYTVTNLKTHIRTYHEGIKFKCSHEGCNSELASKKKLALHMRLHEIGPAKINEKKPRKPQASRVDKGKKKKSYASILSGVDLKPKVERAILDGLGKDIEVVLSASASEVTDTDDDLPLARRIELRVA